MRLFRVIRLLGVLTVSACAGAPLAQAAANISYGVTVSLKLPADAATVRVGRETFWVYHGSFYRQVRTGFVLVPPPHGAAIKALPRGAVKFTLGKATYYRHAGVYFKAAGRRFEVCAAPPGAPAALAAAASDDVPEQVTVRAGEESYVFRDGRFFLESPDGLLGRPVPIGAVTDSFPPDAMSVWYRDSEYFEANGVFFQEVAGVGFKVVPPPWRSPLVETEAIAHNAD